MNVLKCHSLFLFDLCQYLPEITYGQCFFIKFEVGRVDYQTIITHSLTLFLEEAPRIFRKF